MIQTFELLPGVTLRCFRDDDLATASLVEPLEEVIDDLKEQLRLRHILRLQQGNCTIDAGFIWSDLLTGLERIGDHCSNIAGCIIDLHHHDMNTHKALRSAKVEDKNFSDNYHAFADIYHLDA